MLDIEFIVPCTAVHYSLGYTERGYVQHHQQAVIALIPGSGSGRSGSFDVEQ